MKLASLKHLTSNGLKNIWVNRLMSLASIGVLVACMSMIGVALILSLNINKTMGDIEKQNVVMVYFNDRNSVLYGDQDALASIIAQNTSSVVSGTQSTDSDVDDAQDTEDTQSTTDGTSSDATASEPSDEIYIPEDAYVIHNAEEAQALCQTLAGIRNVAKVEYVSKEETLQNVKDSMLEGQEQYFDFIDADNPMSDGARVTLTDMAYFSQTVEQIKAVRGVDSVYSHSDIADTLTAVKNGMSIAGVWIIGILVLISFVIVCNTIRVTMYNRKLEISIMKAVGATDAFIRIPFVVEGIAIGLISAAISTGLLYFLYKAVINTLKDVLSLTSVVPFSQFVLPMAGIFALIGIITGALGSGLMMGKYLKKEGSEFRAL